MRDQILAAIKKLELGAVRVADALPRAESGSSMWIKNPRTIYVNETATNHSPLISCFGGKNIWSTELTTTVIWSTDSKSLSATYDHLCDQLLALRSIEPDQAFTAREAVQTTRYENDLLVTEIEYTFTQLT